MQTNKLLSRFITTGTHLVILAAMLMAALLSSVAPAAAAPLALPRVVSVGVGAQTGALTYGTAGSVSYTVTVTKANVSGGGNGTTADLSVSGLAGFSQCPTAASPGPCWIFSPAALTWSGNNTGSLNSTLTLKSGAASSAGSFNFTVNAIRSGDPGDNASGTGTLAIAMADQTITFGALADKAFGDPDFTVSATASSGLAVSFAAAGDCTIAGDLVSLTGAGACTITASQAGDANYNAAADVMQSFLIAQGTPTITFDPAPLVEYPGSDFTVSATTNSDGALTYSYVSGPCVLVDANAGTFSPTGTGDCVVQADTAATTNFLAGSAQQTITIIPPIIHLYAAAGSTVLPGIPSVTVWGYNSTTDPVTQPGGPTLFVNQGDTVTVALHNQLGESTALLFQGQDMIPDTTGAAPGATKLYSFTASRPGTYLYEAGLLSNAQHQVAMGLYGALVVRPAAANQAYDDAATAFDDEAVLVLSDIDPALNNFANPAAFDMRSYAPKYFLINGKVFPDTAAIPTAAGNRVLLRYINAGLQAYSMSLLGLRQTAVAVDGSPFDYGRMLVAETIAPGQTADMITSIPAAAADGSLFALFDGNLMLHNNKTNNAAGGFGGMLTFLTVSGTPPTGDTIGPAASGVMLSPTSVSATISDAGRGDSDVTAAEFFIDAAGASGTGTAMDPFTPAVTVSVTGTISPALSGSHTIYVHGMDAAGNWGAFSSAVISNDITGPTTSALGLSPNPSNGSVNVALSASASDTASGGSNIAAAEYLIDGSCTVSPDCSMNVSPAGAQVASLTAIIPAATVNALSEGPHEVSVRSQDSLGNWGAPATINLVVDKSGPATSSVLAAPNPNNGTVPFNSSTPAVRVTATFNDALSNISAGEGFIDTVGAIGTGFIFLPVDGLWNSSMENGYADVPLTTINTLSNGNHTIFVRGKDAAGNWGATSTTTLVIDRIAPTISGVVITPNTILAGAASVMLNVTASDAGTGLNGGQYWIDGTATPPAAPTAFTGTSATINTSALAAGAHIVYVRMRDAATNWSAVSSATLYVVQAVADSRTITANGSATQISDANAAAGVLANDEPVGVAGRTAALASAPVRTSGTGAGTITLSCPASLGTAATPAISGNTICTNGAYRVTLNGVGNNNNQRAASKRGTFTFTYTETLNGVPSTATVTITVQ